MLTAQTCLKMETNISNLRLLFFILIFIKKKFDHYFIFGEFPVDAGNN